VSAAESTGLRRAERRWVLIGVVVAALMVGAQVVGGAVREGMTDEPSRLELVERCLTERSVSFERVSGDPIAESAARGSIRTKVEGTSVTIALGDSEDDAERLYQTYADVATPGVVGTRLDRRRKVVFLWDDEPTSSQREFVYLCTLDAQE
jgi:hypothetical protein